MVLVPALLCGCDGALRASFCCIFILTTSGDPMGGGEGGANEVSPQEREEMAIGFVLPTKTLDEFYFFAFKSEISNSNGIYKIPN